jgi:hypothetical protein
MDIKLLFKINNEIAYNSSSSIRITNSNPIFSWNFVSVQEYVIDEYTGEKSILPTEEQLGYEIRISKSNSYLGTDSFIGYHSEIGFVSSQDKFWEYSGCPLDRGSVYYGQITSRDELSRSTGWVTFSFQYNSIPLISNVSISPSIPSPSDRLGISYDFYDDDGDVEGDSSIRWFQNGERQRDFDGNRFIDSSYIQYGDKWVVDISPYDGYEYGERATSQIINISPSPVSITLAKIYPEEPNENDIIKADYELTDDLFRDNVFIRWFINGSIDNSLDNQKYIRPGVVPGDTVSYEIKYEEDSSYLSSSEVTISYSDFVVYDILIDRIPEPLNVSRISPYIRWKTYVPYGKDINYVSIKIGTFHESDNIYSNVIADDVNIFIIPNNLLERGVDYYISIAVSDNNTFDKYTASHFRIAGSRWDEKVDNSTGWMIETFFIIDNVNNSVDTYSSEHYHIVRFYDGSRFGEVRIHNDKLSFLSSDIIQSDSIDTSGSNSLIISGINNDVKIYLNNILVLDATGLFTAVSSDRKLTFGNMIRNSFFIKYKYFYYTVSGVYDPDISDAYMDMSFNTLHQFPESSINSFSNYIKDSKDYKIFSVDPYDQSENSSVYSLTAGTVYNNSTVSRTFAPINNIKKSPDGNKKSFAHANGISIVEGYNILEYSHRIDMDNGSIESPSSLLSSSNMWYLVENSGGESLYINDEGLNIDTTLAGDR